jgi:multisubunit Na+/H+ antiporter MnhG subunit
MCFFAGIPIVIIWVIGFPLYILIRLKENKNKLSEKDTIMKYGLFFAGLNDNAYFWDVLITNLRKVILILVTVLTSPLASTL